MPLVEIGRRSITDFGILDMDTLTHPIHGSIQDWTRIQIWTVLRGKQTNPYTNLEWNPDQGFLGRMTISATGDLGVQNTAILSDKGIRYETQLIYEWEDTERVTNLLINCATQKILVTIRNMALAFGATAISFTPLPIPPSKRCPASIVRVNCESDARLDIVVFAENGIALLQPQDAICLQMIPTPFADAVPSPVDPANDQDPAPPPGQQPEPGSPPYDPISGDDGETPAAPPPIALPGQRGRFLVTGFTATCADRTPTPINTTIGNYKLPVTARTEFNAICITGGPAPSYNIIATDGDGIEHTVLSVLTVVPDYVLQFFTP